MEAAAAQGNTIAFSSITFIEMVYLIEKGRIAAESFTRVTRGVEAPNSSFREISVDLTIARTLSKVDVQQIPDMPDRIVAATALTLQVPLISRDGKIRLSTIQTIW